jgi:hypothetical protein
MTRSHENHYATIIRGCVLVVVPIQVIEVNFLGQGKIEVTVKLNTSFTHGHFNV